MSPLDPQDPVSLGALAAAVKPVYVVALGAASIVWAAAAFVDRVERIESDVQDIKLILCADATAAADTYCKRGAR